MLLLPVLMNDRKWRRRPFVSRTRVQSHLSEFLRRDFRQELESNTRDFPSVDFLNLICWIMRSFLSLTATCFMTIFYLIGYQVCLLTKPCTIPYFSSAWRLSESVEGVLGFCANSVKNNRQKERIVKTQHEWYTPALDWHISYPWNTSREPSHRRPCLLPKKHPNLRLDMLPQVSVSYLMYKMVKSSGLESDVEPLILLLYLDLQ